MEELHTTLKYVSRIKKENIQPVFEGYIRYVKLYSWIKIPVFLMVATIAIYNFFIAGKRYSLTDYNNIKNTMAVILGLIAISLIIIGFLMFKRQRVLKQKIKEMAKKHSFPYKEFKKEINIALKATLGGPGI